VAKTGAVSLNGLVVSKVIHGKTASTLIMSKDVQSKTFTVTIEVNGMFPDGMDPRPDDTIDLALNYDPKVKA
jgi:hypothetical protein